MPTIGHIAAGMAAGRFFATDERELRPAMVAGTVLAVFPDLDWINAILGVPPYTVWSHRGILHSLVAAVAIGLAYALVDYRRWQRPRWAVALWAIGAVASHGMLDLFNHGGIVMWLWPLTTEFVRAPWQPIPSIERGLDLLSPRILSVILAESVIFAPLWLYAVWGLPRIGKPEPAEG